MRQQFVKVRRSNRRLAKVKKGNRVDSCDNKQESTLGLLSEVTKEMRS